MRTCLSLYVSCTFKCISTPQEYDNTQKQENCRFILSAFFVCVCTPTILHSLLTSSVTDQYLQGLEWKGVHQIEDTKKVQRGVSASGVAFIGNVLQNGDL